MLILRLRLKNSLANIWGYMTSSHLLRASFFLTAMGFIAGFLGYLYQILIGRLLNSTELGLFSAIISLVTIISSPLSAITLVLSKKISSLCAKGDILGIRNVGKQTALYIFYGSLFFLIIILSLMNELREYLNNTNSYHIWLFSGIVIAAAFSSLSSAFFQGLQKFNAYISLGLTWAVLRIFSAFFLITLCGLGVAGALGGALISQLLVCLLSFYLITRYLFKTNLTTGVNDTAAPKEHLASIRDIFLIVAATTSFVMMSQLDMIMANQFFAPAIASQYAAAAILGKAVLYVPGGIVFALYPMVISNDANQRSSRHLMKQAIATTLVLCLPICIFYFFFGGNLIQFFYGNKYPEAGELLGYYGFAILPMTLIMVMEHFLLAKGRILFTLIFVLMVPAQITAIFFLHHSLFSLMSIMFVTGSVAVLIGLIILRIVNKKSKLT